MDKHQETGPSLYRRAAVVLNPKVIKPLIEQVNRRQATDKHVYESICWQEWTDEAGELQVIGQG